MKPKCHKCKDELTGRDLSDYYEYREIDIAACPICSDCFDRSEEIEPDYEQHSDADPGL